MRLLCNVYDPVRTVSPKPSGFDTDPNNHNVSMLTGSTGGRIGPSLVLKVMAGDKVQINTFAYFNTATQPPVSDNTLLTDLLSTLVTGVTAQSGGKIGSGNATALSNVVSPNVLSFLNNRTYNSSLPKAYLNWILLDDQFKYVAGNMGAVQAIAGSSKQPLVAPLQTIAKNGYLYVYVSNQSTQNVYFDNLIVTHTTGPLIQEQSYYPFGLQMAGISDKAMNKLTSQNKFNGGVELEEDYGVNMYSTFYRQYDPQIGRFSGVDVLSEKSAGLSAYQFGANNPIRFNDPMGNEKSLPGLTDIINQLWNSPFGGAWSSQTTNLAFEFGDNGTAEYFGAIAAGGGSGFGGSSFFGNLAKSYSFMQGVSKGGNDVYNFDISQSKNGDYFAISGYSPQNDGMNTHEMVSDLGSLGPGYNGLSYSWGNDANLSNSSGNRNQENSDLENLRKATGLGADAFGITTNSLKAAAKGANIALGGLSKTGTVVGAIAGGIPALYHALNGDWEWGRDGPAAGLAVLGIASEFFGIGELWDGTVGVGIAVATTAYDVYDASQQ